MKLYFNFYFTIVSCLVCTGLQSAHTGALQLVHQTHTEWKFACTYRPTLPWHQLQHSFRCGCPTHPFYRKTAIVIYGPSKALGIWNHWFTYKAASPNCSRIVRTKDMHVQAVFARGQLTGVYLSPFWTEEVVSELADIADGGCGCVHLAHKFLQFVKEVCRNIPFSTKMLEGLFVGLTLFEKLQCTQLPTTCEGTDRVTPSEDVKSNKSLAYIFTQGACKFANVHIPRWGRIRRLSSSTPVTAWCWWTGSVLHWL